MVMKLKVVETKKLLGIIFDSALKFDPRIKSLCRKAAQKLSAYSQINKYPSCDQQFLLVNLPICILPSIAPPYLPVVLNLPIVPLFGCSSQGP